jgi:hypothetical protein
MQKHFDKNLCRQKGILTLAGIAIIVVAAVVLFGGVFAWQYFTKPQINLNTQTANWETYTNNEYGFEFNYPGSKIEDLLATDDPSVLLRFGFSNYLFDITKKDSVQQVDYDAVHAPYQTTTKVKEGNIFISGLNWDTLEVDYSPKVNGTIDSDARVSFNKDEIRYGFSCYNCNTDKNKNAIFNQIISTFKFTK